jgi:hypothetical protein
MKRLTAAFYRHPFFWLSAILSLVVLAILLPFLLRSGYLVFGDVTEGILSQNVARRYFWTFDDNIGPALVEKARLPLFTLFWGVFSLFRFPDEALLKVKIVTLFVISLWSFVAAVKLTRKHFLGAEATPSPAFLVATALGTLVFLFNPWMMNRLNHFFLYFGSVNLPLVFALYLDFLLGGGGSSRNLLKLLVIIAITSATPHIIVIEALVILVMSVVVVVFSSERWAVLRRVGVVGAVGAAGAVLLNAYWLWPYLSSLGSGAASPDKVLTLEVLRLLSQYDQIFNTVRLLGYWWPSTKYFMDWNQPLYFLGIAGSLVLPAAFVAYATFGFKRIGVRVIGAVGVVGIFLCSYTPASEAVYSWLMFRSPLQSFGWIWREIDKIGLILVFCFSLTFVFLLARLLAHRFIIPVVILSLLVGVFCYPHVAFTLYYDFAPQYVPKAFFLADDFLAGEPGDFNVAWYPLVVDPVWSTNPDEPGNFAIYSSSEPTLGYSSDTKALLNYALDSRNAAKINLPKFLDLLGVKYLVLRDDSKSVSQVALAKILDNQPGLSKVAQYDFLTIYQNQRFSGLFKLKTHQVVSTLGLETLKYLDTLNIETSNSALVLTDSAAKIQDGLPVSTIMLENGDTNDLVLAALSDYFIYPFNYAFRGDTRRYWSKATATDQVHGELTPLLLQENINNHQLDWRGGVVVASDQKFFASEGYLGQLAAASTPSLALGGGMDETNLTVAPKNPYFTLSRPLSNSSLAWVESVLAPLAVSAGQTYYLEYETTESDWNSEANLRLAFYDSAGKSLRTHYLLPEYGHYQGVVTVPNQAVTGEIQVLGRPATALKITKLRILDVTLEVKRLSLAFSAPWPPGPAPYSLWLRTLDSARGEGLRLRVGQSLYDVSTYSDYNRFNWHYLGDYTPATGNLDLELTNLGGFEVVNALAVVPKEAFLAAQAKVSEILASSQSVIITNPDTALPIRRGYFGSAAEIVSWPINYPTSSKYVLSPLSPAVVSDNLVTVVPVHAPGLAPTFVVDAASAKTLKLGADGWFRTVAVASPSASAWSTVSSAAVPITGGGDYLISGRVSGTALKQFHLKVGDQELFAAVDGNLTDYIFARILRVSDWSHQAVLRFYLRGDAVGAGFKISDLQVEDLRATTIAPTVLIEDKSLLAMATNGGELKVNKIDPTKYLVTLPKALPAAILSFAKPFDTGWQQAAHQSFLTDIILNGWLLPAAASGQLTVTYGPQAYFVGGSVVSIVTVLIVGAGYLVSRRRKKKDRLGKSY